MGIAFLHEPRSSWLFDRRRLESRLGTLPAGIIGFFVAVVLAGAAFVVFRQRTRRAATESLAAAEKTLGDAHRQAEAIRKEAEIKVREDSGRARESLDQEIRSRREVLEAGEKKLGNRELDLERRGNKVETREREITQRESVTEKAAETLARDREELATAVEEVRSSLERAAGLTREEAREALIAEISDEAKLKAGRRVRQIEEEAREDGERRAKKIVAQSIARLAGEWVAERSISIVALPSDDMKGRLIGREGRNIRAIEGATGVDLIIDDTP
jgi:ribonuclease Y